MFTFEVFTIRFNTRRQTVTPLLNCPCMIAWSGVALSVNTREYCVHCIGNISLPPTYFREIIIFLF